MNKLVFEGIVLGIEEKEYGVGKANLIKAGFEELT